MTSDQKKIAVLVCSNVIGGHEFQVKKLAEELAAKTDVTVFLNSSEHVKFFQASGYKTKVVSEKLLKKGWIGRQLLAGLFEGSSLRKQFASFDEAIVCAGAVEASVMTGIALFGKLPIILYLPSFFDRIPLWGCVWGGAYNIILSSALRLFDRVLVINRIQGKIIGSRAQRPALILPNHIRSVDRSVVVGEPKLVYIGRVDRQKRLLQLMDWLDCEANPFQRLLVIGDGPEKGIAVSQSHKMRYLKVEFTGWLDPEEQDKIISDKDVLLLNSIIEGEPLVLREAQARGMRILARNILGVRGVTTSSERFDSQEELVQKLQEKNVGYAFPRRMQDSWAARRAVTINSLARKYA